MTIHNFEVKFYENFAIKFVDVYEELGQLRAGDYAARTLTKQQILEARPYVTAEFTFRDYEFEVE